MDIGLSASIQTQVRLTSGQWLAGPGTKLGDTVRFSTSGVAATLPARLVEHRLTAEHSCLFYDPLHQ